MLNATLFLYERVIHKGLIGPNGESSALCFDPPHPIDREAEAVVLSEWLHDEVTCPQCLDGLGMKPQVSRGHLLRNNLEARLTIAFQMVDANYWNREVRKPGEDKINPDPDGVLATEFLKLTQEFNKLMEPVERAMWRHQEQFGWPSVIDGPDTT